MGGGQNSQTFNPQRVPCLKPSCYFPSLTAGYPKFSEHKDKNLSPMIAVIFFIYWWKRYLEVTSFKGYFKEICILSTTVSCITFILSDQIFHQNLTDNIGPWIFVAFTAHPHDSKCSISFGAHCSKSAKESEVSNTSSI